MSANEQAVNLTLEIMNRTRTLVGFLDVMEENSEVQQDIYRVIETAQINQPNQLFAEALEVLLQHWTTATLTSVLEFCKEKSVDLTPLFYPDVEDDE